MTDVLEVSTSWFPSRGQSFLHLWGGRRLHPRLECGTGLHVHRGGQPLHCGSAPHLSCTRSAGVFSFLQQHLGRPAVALSPLGRRPQGSAQRVGPCSYPACLAAWILGPVPSRTPACGRGHRLPHSPAPKPCVLCRTGPGPILGLRSLFSAALRRGIRLRRPGCVRTVISRWSLHIHDGPGRGPSMLGDQPGSTSAVGLLPFLPSRTFIQLCPLPLERPGSTVAHGTCWSTTEMETCRASLCLWGGRTTPPGASPVSKAGQ